MRARSIGSRSSRRTDRGEDGSRGYSAIRGETASRHATVSIRKNKMRRALFIMILPCVALTGCFGDRNSQEPASEFEREIDAGLDGIEYRLRRLQSDDRSYDASDETIEDLRRHRDELRRKLDEMIDDHVASSDSAEFELRRRLEDLAVRYETARLGQFESRELFEKAVEARFEDLDRELALLEGHVFQGELRSQFDSRIAQLYRLRNDVALRVAETSAASDQEFSRMKSELAAAIGKLDLLLGHTTVAVDRAYEARHPIRSLNRLWL